MNSMEDTMLMSYVLDAGKNRHNMDLLSEIHLNHKTISFKDIVGSGKKKINFSEVEIEKAMQYAAEDADITFRLYKIFKENLKNEKLTNIYEVFEKPNEIPQLIEIYFTHSDTSYSEARQPLVSNVNEIQRYQRNANRLMIDTTTLCRFCKLGRQKS